MATADGGTMQSFQKHIEDMRSLTLCKICLKPFFEPYIISCGHTYCYSCLRSWFGNPSDRKKTKSCPDCRIVVRVQPAPNYILRDLTHMFIGRAELLPEDESVQEHEKDKQDAAAQLTRDREGAGLFQGVFDQLLPTHLRGPIHDIEDGVDRCPMCSWELEDGICTGCGLDMHDTDFDSDDSDDSGETVGELDLRRFGGPPQAMFYGVGSDSGDDSSENESDLSGPNEYDHHDDFLDNENEDDVDNLDDTDGMAEVGEFQIESRRPLAPRRRHRIAFSDEETSEDEERVERIPRGTYLGYEDAHPAMSLVEDSSTNHGGLDDEVGSHTMNNGIEEAESDDEQPVIRSRARRGRNAATFSANRRGPILLDDDDDEEEQDLQSGHAAFSSQAGAEASSSEDESDEEDTTSGQTSDSDSQESSESESGSEMRVRHEYDEVTDGEDTDETITPPQPRHVRQMRLQNQRARRPQQHQSRVPPSMSDHQDHGRDDRLGPRGQTSKATKVY